jgi:transposase-like protein
MLSYKDLARRWGVSTNTLRVWRHRGKLPEPDLVIGRSPGWNLETIERVETQDDPRNQDD